VAAELLRTLIEQLEVLRPALTKPGFENLLVVFVGWIQSNGVHAVTEALVVTGVAGRRHHEKFHRFFSRGTWQPDALGLLLFRSVLRFVPDDQPIQLVMDDTLAPKKGARVFGIGTHIDAVRSTKKHRVFCFGHCWVVLAVRVAVPFSSRAWALPLLFRLYRNKKECREKGQPYWKKTELAHEMLRCALSWTGERRVFLAADSAYCNRTVTHDLPPSLVLLGAMRPDAVLTALPVLDPKRPGRKPIRGKVLPKPQALARDPSRPWRRCSALLYGRRRSVRYKECRAQWYRACGAQLLRIIVVQVATGDLPCRVFFATDASLSVRAILEGYGGRWSIEVAFKNLKQWLGFADSSARKQQAVERTAPFVGLTYTMLVLWFFDHAFKTAFATPPLRPWYRHKRGFSFADVLRTAQRVLGPLDVLDPSRSLDNLRQLERSGAIPTAGANSAARSRQRKGET
jgi:hypothetical protein